jgi:hypothetical protein
MPEQEKGMRKGKERPHNWHFISAYREYEISDCIEKHII